MDLQLLFELLRAVLFRQNHHELFDHPGLLVGETVAEITKQFGDLIPTDLALLLPLVLVDELSLALLTYFLAAEIQLMSEGLLGLHALEPNLGCLLAVRHIMGADLPGRNIPLQLLRPLALIARHHILRNLGTTRRTNKLAAARTDIPVSPLADPMLDALLLAAVGQHELDSAVVRLVRAQNTVDFVGAVIGLHIRYYFRRALIA